MKNTQHSIRLLGNWLTETQTSKYRFAKNLGVTPQSLTSWFSFRTRPRPEYWAKIEELTGGAVPALSWLVTENVDA